MGRARGHWMGICHCGTIEIEFSAISSLASLAPRICSCAFCQRHGARYISDPGGMLVFRMDPAQINLYRFNSQTADFIVCGRCGVLAGAVTGMNGPQLGVLNLSLLLNANEFPLVGELCDYSEETLSDRLRRRARSWMPVDLVAKKSNWG